MAEEKKRLKEFDWLTTKRGVTRNYPMRMVKMIKPSCDECRSSQYGWWNKCPHDPYHILSPVKVTSEKRTVDDATGLVTTVEQEEKVTHYRHVPNLGQVALSLRINSGLGVEAGLAKGWKFPMDVQPTLPDNSVDPSYGGYAPMCEFQNCYESNPKVKTRHTGLAENRSIPSERQIAYYCTEQHARMARQKDSEKMVREVFDPTKRREQLDAISL